MPDWIQQPDAQAFHFFNGTMSNPVFDIIMPLLTEFRYWLPVYVIMFVWLIWKGGRPGRVCAIMLLAAVVLTDQVSASIIKSAVGRLRPCHSLSGIHLLVGCGAGKSFPSSHAANNFGAAMILTYFYRKNAWIFFTLAALVAYSRVYVGVHYPLDVLAGAALGLIMSGLLIIILRKAFSFRPGFIQGTP